jgi:probable F420-dependent oxidoreductase
MGALKVGVFADSTDRSMPLLELAAAVEGRGFGGLFLNEHTHVPVDHPRSTFPRGGPVPEHYARFWDPYVALSFVAATTALEVGPCISLVAEHDPIVLAKTIATLDVLSEGRLVVGVGWGWLREEVEDHGVAAADRVAVATEKVALMKALWTDEVASYEGEHVRLPPSWSWPKPRQRPHPPVLIGAPASDRNFRRIAAWADGWIPMGTPPLDAFPAMLASLREHWDRAGRDPDGCRVTVSLIDVADDELAGTVDRFTEAGVERVLVRVREEATGDVLRRLDRAAEALAPVLAEATRRGG